eukprot:CAMPEP_0197528186 /NCGR_PEP_ID=MMETSP1318-20131121/24200_1 /TAXON_ID=552666 /ORGANISM="Partenskyella glossopodia, Strain RCC365" /LENGTH=362 /DNA_ID=CAMNT_0043083171 /DNA_START=136 /DNA_END=1224 /DNA_ORIENTATION=+
MIGFVFVTSAFAVLLAIDPKLDGSAPNWWLLMAAVCGFIYQTMDGTDGKQARRLKCGSALGECVDHGCDALVATIYAVFPMEILSLGLDNAVGIIFILNAQLAFFVSNLTLVHIGRQDIQLLDCQELQQLVQACALLKIRNPAILDTKIPIPMGERISKLVASVPLEGFDKVFAPGPLTIRRACVLLGVVFPIFHAITIAIKILLHYKSKPQKPNSKQLPGRGVLGLLWQIILIKGWYLGCFAAFWTMIRYEGQVAMVCWVLISMFGFGDLMNRLLVTRVAHVPPPTSLFEMPGAIGLILLVSMAYFRENIESIVHVGFFAAAACTIALHVLHARRTGNVICDALGVTWFTVPARCLSAKQK